MKSAIHIALFFYFYITNKTYPVMESRSLNESELRRYSSQIKKLSRGAEDQQRIKDASILVIGAGGKGTSVLQNLATAGIGQIGIADNFPVEEKYLSKQRLYGSVDIGKEKAIISKQKLKDLNHLIDFELHNVCINSKNILDICREYKIIIDATDNFPARYLINDAAVILNKPVVFGSVFNSLGMVTVFNLNKGPTLRCLYPDPPSGDEKPEIKSIAGIGILYNIVGTIMANEALKIILQIENILSGKLLIFNISDYSISFKSIKLNPVNLKISALD
jgi:molybdopterin/thiamine biosynthesis adenylyltransferase